VKSQGLLKKGMEKKKEMEKKKGMEKKKKEKRRKKSQKKFRWIYHGRNLECRRGIERQCGSFMRGTVRLENRWFFLCIAKPRVAQFVKTLTEN
jgi:hypothetical protein